MPMWLNCLLYMNLFDWPLCDGWKSKEFNKAESGFVN